MYPASPYRDPAISPAKPISQKRQKAAERAARAPEAPVTEGMRVIIIRDTLFGTRVPSSVGLTGTVTGFQYGEPNRPQVTFSDGVPVFQNLIDVRALPG